MGPPFAACVCLSRGADYLGPLRSTDPHAIAGLLKKFFRELPEPLIPPDQYRAFLESVLSTLHFSFLIATFGSSELV